jgi:hypothetical protein
MKIIIALLLLQVALPLSAAQLRSVEKGKKSTEQTLNGSIVSFNNDTFKFHVFNSNKGQAGVADTEVSLPADKYEMLIVVDDNPIFGSVDQDNKTIEMSNPTSTKDTDYQHALYQQMDQHNQGSTPQDRDLTSCHKRGTDWLIPKDGPEMTGTITKVTTAGQTGYVYFQPSDAKSPKRYRFDQLSMIGIGRCW